MELDPYERLRQHSSTARALRLPPTFGSLSPSRPTRVPTTAGTRIGILMGYGQG